MPVSFTRMKVSFYLLNRADNVDVYIVDSDGTIVRDAARLGSPHARLEAAPPVRLERPPRQRPVAPDGNYYIRVSLVHQGRSVLISNSSGAEPVTVLTIPPRPRSRASRRRDLRLGRDAARRSTTRAPTACRAGSSSTARRRRRPRLLKSFAAGRAADPRSGTEPRPAGGRPPPGTYTVPASR